MLAGLVVSASLAGCSPLIAQTASRVGSTLESATEADIIYDLSFPILGREASFSGGSPAGSWVVVADCTAENGHVLAVIPVNRVTSELRKEASRGGFDHFLVECG